MRTNPLESQRDQRDERGATAVEYSILIALIAAIVVGTVAAVGLDTVGNWGIAW